MSYACASKRTKRLGRAEGRPRSRSPLLGPARAIVFSQGPLTPGCSEDLLSTGVTKSYRVTFDRNRYSVPSRLVGQGVLVRGTDDSVSVFLGPKQVASHRRCWGIGEDIHHESHDEGVLAQKPRAAAGQLPPGLTGLGQVGARYLKVFAAGNRSIQREVARLTLLAELFGEQASFLYEKLTGMEFMRFSADLYDVKREIIPQKSKELLVQFALWNWADELIEAYSHGMKQRLIIASALLHDPRILIVDEPMVGLDPEAVHMVKDILKELAANKTTIFISTHTLSIAEDLCHKIGLIHKGTLLAQGSLDELKRIAKLGEARLEEVFLTIIKENTFI